MRLRFGGIEEPHLDAELRERLSEQCPRSPVQTVGGNEVLSRMHDRQQRRRDRCLTAGEGQSSRAAVQRRQALFEDVGRGIHQAGVDVAEFAQAEEVRCVLRAMEHVARCRIDRHSARRSGGVWHLPGVQRQGTESMGWCFVRHCRFLLFR